jgi:hypothetical protein
LDGCIAMHYNPCLNQVKAYKKASKKIKTAIINDLSRILNMNKQDGGDMIQRRN